MAHQPAPDPVIVCVDCGGRAHLLVDAAARTAIWLPGDIVAYRCEDCLDRWDLVLPDDWEGDHRALVSRRRGGSRSFAPPPSTRGGRSSRAVGLCWASARRLGGTGGQEKEQLDHVSLRPKALCPSSSPARNTVPRTGTSRSADAGAGEEDEAIGGIHAFAQGRRLSTPMAARRRPAIDVARNNHIAELAYRGRCELSSVVLLRWSSSASPEAWPYCVTWRTRGRQWMHPRVTSGRGSSSVVERRAVAGVLVSTPQPSTSLWSLYVDRPWSLSGSLRCSCWICHGCGLGSGLRGSRNVARWGCVVVVERCVAVVGLTFDLAFHSEFSTPRATGTIGRSSHRSDGTSHPAGCRNSAVSYIARPPSPATGEGASMRHRHHRGGAVEQHGLQDGGLSPPHQAGGGDDGAVHQLAQPGEGPVPDQHREQPAGAAPPDRGGGRTGRHLDPRHGAAAAGFPLPTVDG